MRSAKSLTIAAIARCETLRYRSSMSDAAISIRSLSKRYAGGKQALDDVSFNVEQGSIFGLLGPNGAGKSTLINILSGMVMKTGGQAVVWGFDIDVNPRNAKASIGIVPQEIMFDPFFTPKEALELQLPGLYGVPKAKRRTRWSCFARSGWRTRPMPIRARLSGGMKRRLAGGQGHGALTAGHRP